MDLTIRRAVAADGAAASDLYLRARHAAARAGSIPPPAHADDETAGWIRTVVVSKLECWLAQTSQGRVVGILVLREDWIEQLYVDPDLTGQGIGAELLNLAKHERPDGLRLWTFVSNEGAQRFYACHGFSEAERTDGSDNEERAPAIQYVWTPVAVTIMRVDARPTAVVARTTTWKEFPNLWGSLLDEVYRFVRGRPDLATGQGQEKWQNVMLYKDDRPDVEVGVLVREAFPAQPPVIASELPAGEVATAIHRGDYGRLGVTHDAVRDHIAANGREPAGPLWEIYGHAPPDPSEAETEVFWLLR